MLSLSPSDSSIQAVQFISGVLLFVVSAVAITVILTHLSTLQTFATSSPGSYCFISAGAFDIMALTAFIVAGVLRCCRSSPPAEVAVIDEQYTHNFNFIFGIASNDLPYLAVEDGKLSKSASPTTPEQQRQGLGAIKYLWEKSVSKMLEADFGDSTTREEALFSLNKLKNHLAVNLPECVSEIDLEKSLRIISGTYKSKCMKELNAPTVAKVRARCLQYAEIEGNHVVEAEWVRSKSGSDFAVRKEEEDSYVGYLLKADDKSWFPPDYAVIAGFNEEIAGQLDLLLGGRLGFPLVMREGKYTIHAFAESKGTYEQQRDKTALHQKMPKRQTQRFVIGQMLMKNFDCHSGNILIGKDFAPIGIDFGRSLIANLIDTQTLLRSAYLEFPHLDEPLDNDDMRFFSELDVNALISTLTENLKLSNPEIFSNPKLAKAALTNLETLRATLILVQEGAKQQCTLRQMLALFFRPFTPEEHKEMGKSLSNKAVDNAFNRAWVQGTDKFRSKIREEIQSIKSYPHELFGKREKKVYRLLGLYIPSQRAPFSQF